MNTIKITIIERHECLPFSELEPDVQEKVIERYGDWNADHDWWNFIYDGFEEDCRERYGIEVDLKGTCFRGFWSQGDGATFTGRVTNIDTFLQQTPSSTRGYPNPTQYHRVIRHMFHEEGLKLTTSPTGFYQTVQRTKVERYNVNPHEFNGRQQKAYEFTEKALDWLEWAWEDVCTDLASELYSRLEREYEYLTSAEVLSETFDTNDCVFDIETGELFYREQAVA